jgi:hypothetical protein
MIEKPPARTGERSGLTPSSDSLEMRPAPIISLAQPREPFLRDASLGEPVFLEDGGQRQRVPDDANASRQCSGPNSPAIASMCARASVSAARNASARRLPSEK